MHDLRGGHRRGNHPSIFLFGIGTPTHPDDEVEDGVVEDGHQHAENEEATKAPRGRNMPAHPPGEPREGFISSRTPPCVPEGTPMVEGRRSPERRCVRCVCREGAAERQSRGSATCVVEVCYPS